MAKVTDTETGLNDRQKKFCEEYLVDLNGKQSAIRAGYSEKTAGEMAYENLNKPQIVAYLNELRENLQQKTGITAEKVVAELAKIGFADVRKFYGGDGQLLPIQSLDDDSAGAISGIKSFEKTVSDPTDPEGEKVIEGKNVEVKTHDKVRALEMLGKHLGVFEKDNKQKAETTIFYIPENGKVNGKSEG